jgi:hypothetical protein
VPRRRVRAGAPLLDTLRIYHTHLTFINVAGAGMQVPDQATPCPARTRVEPAGRRARHPRGAGRCAPGTHGTCPAVTSGSKCRAADRDEITTYLHHTGPAPQTTSRGWDRHQLGREAEALRRAVSAIGRRPTQRGGTPDSRQDPRAHLQTAGRPASRATSRSSMAGARRASAASGPM